MALLFKQPLAGIKFVEQTVGNIDFLPFPFFFACVFCI
jgi:hypothetical protein